MNPSAHNARCASVMFEIYRERLGEAPHRVVYYTEIDERQRDAEIARAEAGDSVYHGFIAVAHLPQAKRVIRTLLERLDGDTPVATPEIDAALAPYVEP